MFYEIINRQYKTTTKRMAYQTESNCESKTQDKELVAF